MGQAGALRLFTAPLSKEMSWLLPFGLFGLALLVFRERLKFPLGADQQAAVVWGGWLLAGVGFFSVAGFFHEYYLAMIAPPLAALVGICVVALWRFAKLRPWLASVLLLGAAGGTMVFQLFTAAAFTSDVWWLLPTLILFAAGIVSLLTALNFEVRGTSLAGFACITGALLITPGIWSALTSANATANQSLPSAYSGQTSGVPNLGSVNVNQALLAFLQQNTQNMKYLMAVPSSMQGSDYVLATGRPVLYMGGFMGVDQVVTSDDLNRLVASGQLRYIYWDARQGNFNNQSNITPWVTANCVAVTGFDVQTQNAGAPDGTGAGSGLGRSFGGGNMQVSLYDCRKG